jgi:RNA polymerase sigma factor (sigma-70 family)
VESESSATWQPAGVDDTLISAIRALPARQREVIVLRIFFDLDTEATAALLGISPGTVGVHLHRALGALRSHVPSLLD